MNRFLKLFSAAALSAAAAAVISVCAYATEASDFTTSKSASFSHGRQNYFPCLSIESYSGDDKIVFITEDVFRKDDYDFTDYGYDGSSYEIIHIQNNTFNDCDTIETIVFSADVDRIFFDTITGCDNLKSVIFLGMDTTIDYLNNGVSAEQLTIYGIKGSTAEKYAETRGTGFVEINDPDTLSIKPARLTSGKIKLTWDDIKADSYTVTAISSKGKETVVYEGSSLKYTYSPKKTDAYKFKVTAQMKITEDVTIPVRSTESKSVLGGKVQKLDKPVVSTKTFSKAAVKLSWKKVSGANEYVIYYAKKGSKKFKELATTSELNYTFVPEAKGTYYFKVVAQKNSDGIITAKSSKSKQKTVKLTNSTFTVKDTGYYTDSVPGDPEYEIGATRKFVNGSHLAGTDIPAGLYLITASVDNNNTMCAIIAKKPGVAASVIKASAQVYNPLDKPFLIYVPEGKYLTLQYCNAELFNGKTKLPDNIMWAGKNFKAGRVKLGYDGTMSYGYIGSSNSGYAASYFILDTNNGNKITQYNYSQDVIGQKNGVTVNLKDGQILILGEGAKFL